MVNMWGCGTCGAYGDIDEFEILPGGNPTAVAVATEAHNQLSSSCQDPQIKFE